MIYFIYVILGLFRMCEGVSYVCCDLMVHGIVGILRHLQFFLNCQVLQQYHTIAISNFYGAEYHSSANVFALCASGKKHLEWGAGELLRGGGISLEIRLR